MDRPVREGLGRAAEKATDLAVRLADLKAAWRKR
jgi:hypothetical protein